MTLKGVAVKLDNGNAGVLFDTATLTFKRAEVILADLLVAEKRYLLES